MFITEVACKACGNKNGYCCKLKAYELSGNDEAFDEQLNYFIFSLNIHAVLVLVG